MIVTAGAALLRRDRAAARAALGAQAAAAAVALAMTRPRWS